MNFLKLSAWIKVPRYLLENILKREVSEERQTCKSSVLKHGADPEKESNVLSSYLTKTYLKFKGGSDRQITLNVFYYI